MEIGNQARALTNFADRVHRNRVLGFAAAVLILTAVSTHGTFDNFANTRLAETTGQSLVIFGIARGLNAAVSVFQSAELSVPSLASISVGEALGPVNDAVERLSTLMTWAIGSLLLQGVVLAFVSSTVFKWIFGLIAALTIASLIIVWRRQASDGSGYTRLDRFCTAAVKVFIVASVVRFIVPVFVLVSYLAGQALLQPEIDRQSGQLSAISDEVSIDDGQRADQPTVDLNGVVGDDEQNPSAEESTSLFDRARAAAGEMLPDIGMPDLSVLSVLLEQAGNLSIYLTRLLVLISIKNILLPLVFLAIALKVIKPATVRLLAMTASIERDLKSLTGKETRKQITSA